MLSMAPTKEELLAAIHSELHRLAALLDHLDVVLPEHEKKIKEQTDD